MNSYGEFDLSVARYIIWRPLSVKRFHYKLGGYEPLLAPRDALRGLVGTLVFFLEVGRRHHLVLLLLHFMICHSNKCHPGNLVLERERERTTQRRGEIPSCIF